MASGYTMLDPICLVENQNNQLTVNPKAVEILDMMSQPVVVVAIAGLYRTGKSYLMNRLAGKNQGFCLGSTVRSETKGIWMWCIPHPSKPSHTLVLLDTEGLGDVEKGDSKNDSWIFALAVLLSSMFVYNSMNTINHQALEQLHYVTELTKLIRTKSSPISGEGDDSAMFASFFPDFVWAVRDFTLELELGGCIISEDEYLENALKLVPGEDPKIQQANIPREYIKKFFPKRKCFTFDWPTTDKKLLHRLDGVLENQLVCTFQEQSKNFCNYIFTEAKTKTLGEGIIVTGNRLGILGKAYVDAINSGAVPCLENAVTTLAERENSAAMQKAADHYSEQMAQRVSFPTDTLQELLDLHAACKKEALEIFMEHSIMDEKQGFQEKLMDIIEKKKKDFLLQNEDESGKYCHAQLMQLSEPLMESISRGMFSVPNGYKLYLEAIDKLEQSYTLVPRKGVKAMEVLQNFKQSQAATKESILQAGKALTAGEKALADEQAKREALEREQELLRQILNETQQKMEDQERSFKEHIALTKEKMKKIKENEQKNREEMEKYKQSLQESLKKHQEKEMQHEIEVQRIKAESEATTRKIFEEVQKKNEQRWEEREKNYQEQVKRLEETEKERAEEARNAKYELQVQESLKKEQEKEMQHKIEVQRIKAESEATTRKTIEEVQKKNEQRWEEREKNYQEQVKRLEETEKERAEEARIAKYELQESERKNDLLHEKNRNLQYQLLSKASCNIS